MLHTQKKEENSLVFAVEKTVTAVLLKIDSHPLGCQAEWRQRRPGTETTVRKVREQLGCGDSLPLGNLFAPRFIP